MSRAAYDRGRRGEFLASLYLNLKGYRILERRFKTSLGEIDIIARRGKTIIFVEVKSHGDNLAGLERISPQQQSRIHRAAHAYLGRFQDPQIIYRFDVMTVGWKKKFFPYKLHITHIPNAYEIL